MDANYYIEGKIKTVHYSFYQKEQFNDHTDKIHKQVSDKNN